MNRANLKDQRIDPRHSKKRILQVHKQNGSLHIPWREVLEMVGAGTRKLRLLYPRRRAPQDANCSWACARDSVARFDIVWCPRRGGSIVFGPCESLGSVCHGSNINICGTINREDVRTSARIIKLFRLFDN